MGGYLGYTLGLNLQMEEAAGRRMLWRDRMAESGRADMRMMLER